MKRKTALSIALSVVVAIGAAGVLARIYWLPGALKAGIIRNLQTRFHSDLEIADLQVQAFPHIEARASGIRLHIHGRRDVPPLVAINQLVISASFNGLLHRHVSRVFLQGLQIRIPPRPPGSPPSNGIPRGKAIKFPLVLDEIIANDALIETLPSDPKHVPRDFNLHTFRLGSFSFEHPAPFEAILTNPLPLGEIHTQGQFGPWNGEDPAQTPVSGTFYYTHADFSSIHGLSGTMSSAGKFGGELDRIDVEGDTEMPDFALALSGNPVPLRTHYIAVVDGTNGDTFLHDVHAQLANSTFAVDGAIEGIPGVPGKRILLHATSESARAEDLLRLALKGGAPLRGAIGFHADIDVPPGNGGNVLDRLHLDGKFALSKTHFTDPEIQGKLDSLSRAGQGRPKDWDVRDVVSDLRGQFVVNKGLIRFSTVDFQVPGADIQLAGTFNMLNSDLDFHGDANLDVKLSQTTTGAKSLVLRLADPFFKRPGGGSTIPIQVTGSRDHPSFGLDRRHKPGKDADVTASSSAN